MSEKEFPFVFRWFILEIICVRDLPRSKWRPLHREQNTTMSYHKSSTSILSSLDKDYIEEGRNDIYKWGEKRTTRRRGIHGWGYAFKKRFIDKSILKSFLHNLTLSLLLQLILSGLFTYICQRLGLYMDVHIALFVSPIIFPLAFSINADFQRREHVLEDLALFKGGLIVLFFCHRDWHVPAGLSQEFLKASTNKLKGLILNVKEYLLTEDEVKRSFILQVIYEDFSDISQMNEKLRVAMPSSHSLIQRVIHCHNLMFWAFERLRVIREYRSPRGIRSFTKVFIFVMPILLSPYYVFVGVSSGNSWSPYYISLVTTFVFGTLQGVQDVLDDPFDGISEDDVNLGSLEDWTAHSLLTNRTYTIGRFTVTASVKTEEAPKDTVTVETRIPQVTRNPSFKEKVNAPLRSILRRTSHPRNDFSDRDRPDTLSTVSEEDVGALFPAGVAMNLETMKQRGMTGSTTILPGFHIKEHKELSDEIFCEQDGVSTRQPSLQHRTSNSVAAEIAKKRRAYRQKNVSFSKDLDDDVGNNSLDNSLNAGDDFPLLRDSGELQANKRSQSLETDPDKFPKELLQSMEHLQHSSGTERVCPSKINSKDIMPSSLASLFQGSTSSGESDCPKENDCKFGSVDGSAATSLSQKSKSSRENDYPLPNQNDYRSSAINNGEEQKVRNISVEKPCFSVPKTDEDSTSRNSITTFSEDDQMELKSSRFAVKPFSQRGNISPLPSPNRSPSMSRDVKVQLPSKIFQVVSSLQTSEIEEKQLGETNHGLCTCNEEKPVPPSTKGEPRQSRFSVTSPLENKLGTSTTQENQKRPSRFSVSSPIENKSTESITQEDQKQPSRVSVSSLSENKPSESLPEQDQKRPSRFSVSSTEKESGLSTPQRDKNSRKLSEPSTNTSPQEDQGLRERQSSFWDFSSGDGDPTIKTLSRRPSVEEILSLSDNTNSEVFI